MKLGSKILILTASMIGLLLAGVGLNTLLRESRQIRVQPVAPLALDELAAARRLSGAVRIRTITYDDRPLASASELLRLHAYLAANFPRVHQTLKREVVDDYSLLFTWQGSDPSSRPILLMAHQDVVPIAPGTEEQWQSEPFGGEIKDGYVWGRGSWDDKGNLLSILEALELLIASGFQPTRTIYLASGHDEEAGSRSHEGARALAALLKQRGVRPEFTLDEGLVVTQGVMKGLDAPVALIGIAEKGYLTLRLTAHGTPGHSSMPPLRSSIARLGGSLDRLEEHQMPGSIHGVARAMFETTAPEFHGINRILLSNLWLFAPLIRMQLEHLPSANAMMRTTTAPTVLRAGEKEQTLPARADGLVNFRLLPGDSVEDVIRHTTETISDDSVRVAPIGLPREASRISSTKSPAYHLINQTIREIFPGAIVAPGLMIAATDSSYMSEISENTYRFSPVRARTVDLDCFHGTNERLSIANYGEMIRFYRRLLLNTSGGARHEP